METVDFKKKIYGLPIIPLFGNEIFHIGMRLDDLNSILWEHYSVYGEQHNDGFCLIYNIQLESSIKLSLDILNSHVFRIEFLRDYRGRFEGIGIGSTIKELCEKRDDVYFDEEYIMVGEYPYDFIISIDNFGNSIYSLESVYSNKITKIVVENKSI